VIGDARESLDALDQALGDYRAPTSWFEEARRHVRSWNDYLDGWRGRTELDPPSYGQVIRACNALATPADYVVCAAGGIVGELTMAWSALAENTFDCEWGFSTMGYEVSGAWGEHGTERRTDGVDRRGARVHG
jgi:3D-(3,5/4)-trihydroxycyclohexane-1,2-dione acylhydrolase (decyclizing)